MIIGNSQDEKPGRSLPRFDPRQATGELKGVAHRVQAPRLGQLAPSHKPTCVDNQRWRLQGQIFYDKAALPDGSIVEMVIWRLPSASAERRHGLKYRLYYGRDGRRIVGYGNERGKGDHKHIGDKESCPPPGMSCRPACC